MINCLPSTARSQGVFWSLFFRNSGAPWANSSWRGQQWRVGRRDHYSTCYRPPCISTVHVTDPLTSPQYTLLTPSHPHGTCH